MARPPDPETNKPSPPAHGLELTDEDSVELFFSFDVTTCAFLGNPDRPSREGLHLTVLPSPPASGGDWGRLGPALLDSFRGFFRHPLNWGYVGIAVLTLFVFSRVGPIEKAILDRMTSMVPPEMSISKPVEERPKVKPLSRPEPVQPAESRPEPVPETPVEPVVEPIQPTETRVIPQERRPLAPAVERIGEIQAPVPKRFEESKLDLGAVRRSPGEPSTGLTPIERRRSGPAESAASDMPQTRPSVRNVADVRTEGVPSVVQPRKRSEIAEEGSGGVRVSSRPAQRAEPGESSFPAQAGQGRAAKRSEFIEGRLDGVAERTRPIRAPLAETPSLPTKAATETTGLRIEEDVRGIWQRLENTGPLAHLNAYCFGKADGEIIYRDIYRLRCSANQIVEAWRRK